MKKTIVVADRDEKVRQAFMTMFSKEQFAFFWASNGKEVEKLAARMNPDIYLVNINLPKMSGIEVHRRLQKEGRLYNASFFFLKDEAAAEPVGIEVDGVIEKPINFFRVYETLTSDDEVIELTDLVEEKTESLAARVEDLEMEGPALNPRPSGAAEEWPQKDEVTKSAASEDPEPQATIGRQLRQAMDGVGGGVCLEGARGAGAAPLQSEARAAVQGSAQSSHARSGREALRPARPCPDQLRRRLREADASGAHRKSDQGRNREIIEGVRCVIDKVYDPKQVEQTWRRYWMEKGYFIAKSKSEKRPFSIVIPPPNVTGVLHMGHALNNTLQDVVVRFKRMSGFNALWLPGTDHAGIATQNVVERELAKEGLSAESIGRDAFIRKGLGVEGKIGGPHHRAAEALGRFLRLVAGALHHG